MFSPWRTNSSLVTPYLVFIFCCSLLQITYAQQRCEKLGIRREWAELSVGQKETYMTALVSYIKNNGKEFQGFGDKHNRQAGEPVSIHGTYLFLPWHRYFCREFELKMKALNSAIDLPYWDASRRSTSITENPVFHEDAFGSAGGREAKCITNGKLKGLKLPNGICVASRGGGDRTSVTENSIFNSVINEAKNFSQLSDSIEGGYHSSVHVFVGGNMIQLISPYDPLFFLHHCNVDRLWALWQNNHKNNPARVFQDVKRLPDDKQTVDTPIRGYENIKLGQVMRTRDLCYVYIDTATDAEIKAVGGTVPNPQPQQDGTPQREQDGQPQQEQDEQQQWEQDGHHHHHGGHNHHHGGGRHGRFRKRNYDHSALSTEESLLHLKEPGVLCLGEVAHIVHPKDLPEKWIKMNNLDVKKVRNHEKWRREKTDRLNSIPGYVKGSSIIYKKNYLKGILESHRNPRKVTFYVRGKKIEVSAAGSCDETVERIISAFNHENSRHPKPKKEAIISIIGHSVYNDKVTTINPFRSCA